MSSLIIRGGNPLCGVVSVHGAKNSVLPIAAGCLLCADACVIDNCPQISDAHSAVTILNDLGCRTIFENNTFRVDSRFADGCEIPDKLMRRMRSSIVFLGAMLARCGYARVSLPGGCDIGLRPVDLHFSSLALMGVEMKENGGYIECSARHLHGADISLPYPSVGATENIMLAAATADGTTTVCNAAREPEIEDLQNFLNACGANISGAGSSMIVIRGVSALHGCVYSVIPDRIVTATYLCAVAATRGNALLTNVCPAHLGAFLDVMRRCGCKIKAYDDTLSVECERLHCPSENRIVRSMPYPGFPTDAGSPYIAAMSVSDSTCLFAETVFENRFKFVPELVRMGAKIRIEGRVAVIDGVKRLFGADVQATDLRGGAALAVAALAAEGQTTIENADYILRGYESLDRDLSDLGAEIYYQ